MSRWSDVETHETQALIRLQLDAEHCYGHAAELSRDDTVIAELRELGTVHARMMGELRALLERRHEPLPEGGTAGGSLRRFWIDLVGSLESSDDVTLLKQLQRVERRTQEAYDQAVSEVSSKELLDMLAAHVVDLGEVRNRLEDRLQQQQSEA